MRRTCLICFVVLALAACSGSGPDVPVQSTDSPIAGRTLSCQTGGPSSNLTFGTDGTISGRLLSQKVAGRWYADENGEVHTHVVAGPVSLRDTLRQTTGGWTGQTTSCTG